MHNLLPQRINSNSYIIRVVRNIKIKKYGDLNAPNSLLQVHLHCILILISSLSLHPRRFEYPESAFTMGSNPPRSISTMGSNPILPCLCITPC